MSTNFIQSSVAYPFVIGCSLFSIAWGIVNILLVSTSIQISNSLAFSKSSQSSEKSLQNYSFQITHHSSFVQIKKIDMKDSSHIRSAPHDTEQHLLEKENLSNSENCLNTMKHIADLIEAVSLFLHALVLSCPAPFLI